MAIQDLAANPIAASTQSTMLGYTQAPEPEEILQLRMYNFLLEPIRQADTTRDGALFVKRYLEGPQAIWKQTQEKIFAIKSLWSITECPDEFLKYLKNIVGWTDELKSITDRLGYDELRRLIAASAPLWKSRGSEDTLADSINLVTGATTRILNWFDYRWLLGETTIGEDHQGLDSWLVEPVGSSSVEYYSTLRIVDDGTLDRELVIEMIKLMRSIGERYEVVYVDFMDLFPSKGIAPNWEALEGTESLVAADGSGTLSDTASRQSVQVNTAAIPASTSWSNYQLYSRMKSISGGEYGVIFYIQDSDNYYQAAINIGTNKIELSKKVAGAFTPLGDHTPAETLGADIWYALRVHVVPEFGATRIQVYFDADLIIDTTDSVFSNGNLGVFHAVGADITLDEIEMFQLPLETEVVDINP